MTFEGEERKTILGEMWLVTETLTIANREKKFSLNFLRKQGDAGSPQSLRL